MAKLRVRKDVKPGGFVVKRNGWYVPLDSVGFELGEQAYYHRGPGHKIEPCSPVDLPWGMVI